MDAKKKTNKKNIPQVDLRSYVGDSLSKAASSIENAFNAVSSTASSGAWEYGHAMNSGNITVSSPSLSDYSNTNNIPHSYGSFLPYQDSSSLYPKVDIEKHCFEADNYEYTVYIYLAGVSKSRVQLKLERGGYIGTVFYAPKMTVHILPEKNNKPATSQEWFLKESKQSFTTRTLMLPDDSDIQGASPAVMENGVLVFHVPRLKTPEHPSEIVSIKIT